MYRFTENGALVMSAEDAFIRIRPDLPGMTRIEILRRGRDCSETAVQGRQEFAWRTLQQT